MGYQQTFLNNMSSNVYETKCSDNINLVAMSRMCCKVQNVSQIGVVQ